MQQPEVMGDTPTTLVEVAKVNQIEPNVWLFAPVDEFTIPAGSIVQFYFDPDKLNSPIKAAQPADVNGLIFLNSYQRFVYKLKSTCAFKAFNMGEEIVVDPSIPVLVGFFN